MLGGARRSSAMGEPDLKAQEANTGPRVAVAPGAWTWAALMRRVFAFDVLACPRCGGRLRVIATVHDPLAVQAILAHLRRSLSTETSGAQPRPSRPRATSLAARPAPHGLTLAGPHRGPAAASLRLLAVLR